MQTSKEEALLGQTVLVSLSSQQGPVALGPRPLRRGHELASTGRMPE